MAPFLNLFEERLAGCGVRRGDRILVAFSGGADSTALLHALARLAPAAGLTLAAAHLNHGFRPEADEEQQFCQRQCAALAIPFHAEQVVVPAGKGSRQMEARTCRYAFLERIAHEAQADWIAFGHHADDAVETLFLKLLSGTSPAGLAAIPPRRGRCIRPLLLFGRDELTGWLEAEHIPWIEDASNAGVTYRRNFLRNRVFPLLEERWPAFRAAARRLSATAGEENLYWEEYLQSRGLPRPPATGPVCVPLAGLRALAPVACARYCTWVVARFARMPGQRFFRALPHLLRDDRARLWYRDREWWLYSREGVLCADTTGPGAVTHPVFRALIAPGVLDTPTVRLVAEEWRFDRLPDRKFFQEHAKKGIFFFDAARLSGPLAARTRQPGDRLALPGGGSASVKKLLIDGRIPVRLRRECLVLEDERGPVALLVPRQPFFSRLVPRVLLEGAGPALRLQLEPRKQPAGGDGTDKGGG
jgi:tRNA(Ile)-lysidine synthase